MPVVPDWYCCLAVAIEAEEDAAYNNSFNAYIAAGGDPKKFPARKKRQPAARAAQKNPLDMIMKAVGGALPRRRGTLKDYSRTKESVYRLPDGTFVDKAGKPIEPPEGSVFVPIE